MPHCLRLIPLCTALALILSGSLLFAACQGASTQLAFPVHHQQLGTSLGQDYMSGELRVEDGCLKLYRLGWDDPNRPAGWTTYHILLPVWPSGFTLLQQDGGEISVIDTNGMVAARPGDIVRFAQSNFLSDETKEELAQTVPEPCRGQGLVLFYLVGDEVSVVPHSEPKSASLPGSTLHFPRGHTKSQYITQMTAQPPQDTVLTLDGDCLRVGEGGPVVVWPPGFYPDIIDGRVAVRNGGGKLLALQGEKMALSRGGYIPDDLSGPCRGDRWEDTHFSELPPQPQR